MLPFLSPLWGLALFGLCLFLTLLVAKKVPFYAELSADASRFGQLDGLRGLLAFGVVLTHAVTFRDFYATGQWSWPDSRFYTLCGSVAVALFFMITGFLFCRKAILEDGRIQRRKLYAGRIRRLLPLYIVSVLLTFILVGFRTHWTRQVPLSVLGTELFEWAAFAIPGRPAINGFEDAWATNTAIWTLRYEWAFYLVVPLLARFVTKARFPWLAVVLLVAAWFLPERHAVAANFALGMVAAYVVEHELWREFRESAAAALLAVVSLGVLAWIPPAKYGLTQSLVLFPFFLCVVSENPFFRTLNTPAAKTLGAASYSLYLLHCPVLYGAFYAMEGSVDIGGIPYATYWLMVFGLVPIIVVLSLVSYRWIEWVGLSLPLPRFSRAPARELPAEVSLPDAPSSPR